MEGKTVDNSTQFATDTPDKHDGKEAVFVDEKREKALLNLPAFPPYQWPPFLQQMLSCAPSAKQQDGLLLSVLSVLGSTLNWTVHTHYGGGPTYPNLLTFIVGRPAAGKSVMGWAKQLAWPFHKALQNRYDAEHAEYKKAKTAWDYMGRERNNHPIPEEPVRKLFIIPGNNSATGIKDNLITADGVGLIFETEADTMSSAISADYGHWTDTLRKGYDNDEISFARRLGNEYKQCQRTCFSVLLTGTYGQVPSLIPSRTDGTLSRFLFYNLPPINEWKDQFDCGKTNFNHLFRQWGEGWKRFLDLLRAQVSSVELQLTKEQQRYFNATMSRIFNRAIFLRDDTMKSTVARLGLSLVRMMCVVAFLRAIDHLLSAGDPFVQPWKAFCGGHGFAEALLASPYFAVPEKVPGENLRDGAWSALDMFISDEDLEAIMGLAEPLVAHSSFVIDYLPQETVVPEPLTEASFLQRLPVKFKREEALKIAADAGLSTRKLDRILKKGVEEGTLEKIEFGFYIFKAKEAETKEETKEEKKE